MKFSVIPIIESSCLINMGQDSGVNPAIRKHCGFELYVLCFFLLLLLVFFSLSCVCFFSTPLPIHQFSLLCYASSFLISSFLEPPILHPLDSLLLLLLLPLSFLV